MKKIYTELQTELDNQRDKDRIEVLGLPNDELVERATAAIFEANHRGDSADNRQKIDTAGMLGGLLKNGGVPYPVVRDQEPRRVVRHEEEVQEYFRRLVPVLNERFDLGIQIEEVPID